MAKSAKLKKQPQKPPRKLRRRNNGTKSKSN
jgi:hypothetical protein